MGRDLSIPQTLCSLQDGLTASFVWQGRQRIGGAGRESPELGAIRGPSAVSDPRSHRGSRSASPHRENGLTYGPEPWTGSLCSDDSDPIGEIDKLAQLRR